MSPLISIESGSLAAEVMHNYVNSQIRNSPSMRRLNFSGESTCSNESGDVDVT